MSYYKEVINDISGNMQELGKQIPDVMKAFSSLVGSSTSDGVLDRKTKELIAIGIAVANRCDGCIGFHTKTLVGLGITEQELAEALGVAVAMGGGPSVMYAANTLKAFKEFS
ncbi:carboxymuconolactone decarboxylase family protein [Morganella psychrotolerans]|uniref:Alkylhydroperoxidase n=1 Tax=Morganella psychrotolerans TaxID=368603 RepID=A0A1B8HQY1_9GAMM|nr:carboxymuconolactone decarboxylase family protein [Morganella psychrotolerans]OBU11844.1 alkylhydroperoxidase [Morganella psychrotolerans]